MSLKILNALYKFLLSHYIKHEYEKGNYNFQAIIFYAPARLFFYNRQTDTVYIFTFQQVKGNCRIISNKSVHKGIFFT